MKSDWDDAPDYLRSKKKPGSWRMVAILAVGSAITLGLIALFAKPIVINVDQLKQAIHVDGKPLFSQQHAPQLYSEPEELISLPSIPIDPPVQRIVYEPVSQPQQHASIQWTEEEKARAIASSQNVFSDKNYTPKQPAQHLRSARNTSDSPSLPADAAAPNQAGKPRAYFQMDQELERRQQLPGGVAIGK